MPGVDFNPDRDIPSLAGKVVFVTGGTSGLGRESVLALAKHGPAHIYFTGRNAQAAQSLAAAIAAPSTFLELDMTALPTVRAALAQFAHDRLDILLCNAGIMASPPALTKDGFELQFGTNHLAHGLVIRTLLPVLEKTAAAPGADVRIVSLTSLGWRGRPSAGILFDQLRTPMDAFMGSWVRYGQSKLANIVYARALARRYPNITTVSIHPGTVQTGLVSDLPLVKKAFVYGANWAMGVHPIQPHQGCLNQVWAAAGAKKSELVNGGFYLPIGILGDNTLDKLATSPELEKKLWDWTAEMLAEY